MPSPPPLLPSFPFPPTHTQQPFNPADDDDVAISRAPPPPLHNLFSPTCSSNRPFVQPSPTPPIPHFSPTSPASRILTSAPSIASCFNCIFFSFALDSALISRQVRCITILYILFSLFEDDLPTSVNTLLACVSSFSRRQAAHVPSFFPFFPPLSSHPSW